MADEIKLESMTVTPEVLETIAEIATREVAGVAGVDGGIVSLIGGKKGVTVAADDAGALVVTLHVKVAYGTNMREVALGVQNSIADAMQGMTGSPVGAVDVFVDGVVFPE
jgi:uncharacterized alkaline shock family protein YloU